MFKPGESIYDSAVTISTWKKIIWFALAMSAGYLLLIGVLIGTKGFPPAGRQSTAVYTLAALCLLITPFLIFFLRSCYRREPFSGFGHWHLTFADCYAATFFSAFAMAYWNATWPGSFLFWGAGVSVVAGIWLLLSLIAAAREGFTRFKTRLAMGCALAMKSYGMLAMAALVMIILLILIMEMGNGLDQIFRFIGDITGVRGSMRTDDWFPLSLRLGFIAFPIGWIAARQLRLKVLPAQQSNPS